MVMMRDEEVITINLNLNTETAEGIRKSEISSLPTRPLPSRNGWIVSN